MLMSMKTFLERTDTKLVLNNNIETTSIDEIIEVFYVVLEEDVGDYLDLKLGI